MRAWLAVSFTAVLVVPAALAAPRPSVRPVSPAATRVAGTGFAARELVTVIVRTDGGSAQTVVRATAGGSFVARFAKPVPRTPCGRILVTAVGAHGDRAGWKSPPPVCGTQLAP